MSFIYNFIIHCYCFAIWVVSLWNEKAAKWVGGRKDIFARMKEEIIPGDKIVWFHCASLGEFEQGRPVMEQFRKNHPDFKILLTFFSPSGYEIRKDYAGADYIFYLPVDTKKNAEHFLKTVNPCMAVFVKYEYWYHYFNTLKNLQIPLLVISAIFRKEQHFFQWYGGWFRNLLRKPAMFFVQDDESGRLLYNIGISNVVVSGDTRFDRVADIAKNINDFHVIEKFKNNKLLLIAGSTWQKDEQLLMQWFKDSNNLKMIVTPHEIDNNRINALCMSIPGKKGLKFSAATVENVLTADFLIIDSIGILSSVYRYGEVAYIGGGFGAGIHNILEATVFGLPVLFGPNYHKSKEAVDLAELKAAFCVKDQQELNVQLYKLLDDKDGLQKFKREIIAYMEKKKGATNIIIKYIEESV